MWPAWALSAARTPLGGCCLQLKGAKDPKGLGCTYCLPRATFREFSRFMSQKRSR